MKKNLDKLTLESVNLTDEDLIALNSKKHICLLRENQVYQINADLRSIIKNPENLGVKYLHRVCKECQEETYKNFIPFKTLKEVYSIINKDCGKSK